MASPSSAAKAEPMPTGERCAPFNSFAYKTVRVSLCGTSRNNKGVESEK